MMSEIDGSWWEWANNVKEKVVNQSSEVLEFVKKDIEEFSKVVSEEASNVISNVSSGVSGTATSIKETLQLNEESISQPVNQMKESMSGFFSHVTEVFSLQPDDQDEQAIMIWNQEPIHLDRVQAAKYAFCSDSDNFLRKPDCEDFEKWVENYETDLLKEKEEEFSNILADDEYLMKSYMKIVPKQISHSEFCRRYFYEVEKIEAAELKRKKMKQRANAINFDDDIIWTEDDDLTEKTSVILTEETQTNLLESYEKELKEQKTHSKQSSLGKKSSDSSKDFKKT